MPSTWKARLNRMFRNGKCLDVAIDHGIFNEPTFIPGLEDIDGVVGQLVKAMPDAIQTNYGQADTLQRVETPEKPALVLRIDVGNAYNTIRHREMWSILQNPEEPLVGAIQMDAVAVVVNMYLIPNEPGLLRQSIENVSKVRRECEKYGMPLMLEPLVMQAPSEKGGYLVDGDTDKIVAMVRTARELGADVIKADPTDNVEDFHKVVEAARCPVLVRGGGKGEIGKVFEKSVALMGQGANGMVYGRNVYQHDNPARVAAALKAIIHDGADATRALEIYNSK
ncbi:class I fructose-bisphosphate aldolase [Thalassospira sp. TSL5-1]|uniref:class I fructose-bisphosphate aldolase n=1 Tax=Thalassospira sp. TSL5-1 TaxID=1544451 RepID=UPI00093F9A34|nr:aldolase [Thalassospira sp. TSL5-1]OKH86283.1 aldolase [Thalassospira sp. TSL5-1]